MPGNLRPSMACNMVGDFRTLVARQPKDNNTNTKLATATTFTAL